MENLINRKQYLDKLDLFRDRDLIKVVTGLRRSGKSTLLNLYSERLKATGVSENRIHDYDFEKPENYKDKDWFSVYTEIQSKAQGKEKQYVFIDEPQNIPEFERMLDGLFAHKNIDLYVTGSNATMLSSDIATLLSGRYVEIPLLPFSFQEYVLSMNADTTNTDTDDKIRPYMLFDMFMEQTALPLGVSLQKVSSVAQKEYIQSVYNTVVEKDIIARNKIRNVRAFENLIKYVFAHIGSELSPNNIAIALKADGQKVDSKTIENYLSYLVSAFLLYRADRFDIRGKKQLATKEKYYLVDVGFRNVCLGKMKLQDRGHILENIVYLELLRRNYQVWVGKSNDKEIDFVAKSSDGGISYYQVAWTLEDTSTFQREITALESIKDYYPKYVITHDMGEFVHNGIRQLNIVDWLLES